MKTRRSFLRNGLAMLALPLGAHAQQPTKIPRIGFLIATSPSVIAARIDAFRQGLRELGYVEGKSIAIDFRWADAKLDRLPALAAELVRLNVDVIVTAGPADTRAARGATSRIPIVMGFDPDPVANGFVASLARPGGNITGLATLAPELVGKQLELMKEIVRRLSRVAVIGSSTEPGNARVLKEMDLPARALGLKLQILEILDPRDIETAFRAATKARAEAILVLQSPLTTPVALTQRNPLIDLAAKSRLPTMYSRSEFVEAGGLMSYGTSFSELARRAATYVDKILKGRSPADLPVEQATKFEFFVNLKAAKQIGLTIPPNVLARADKVIE